MIEAICADLARKTVVMEDAQELPITNFFDSDGDDCDFDDAVTCVAGPDKDGLWVTIDFREMERVTLQ